MLSAVVFLYQTIESPNNDQPKQNVFSFGVTSTLKGKPPRTKYNVCPLSG